MRYKSLLLAVVPVLGLAELGLHQLFRARAPGFDAYAALGQELTRAKLPGMPVVVAPRWAEPLVRQAAPEAFPLAELTRPDDSGFASFLQVSLLGATAPELAGLSVRGEKRVGPFTLTVLDRQRPERIEFDFVTAVDTGQVEVWHDVSGQRAQCRFVRRERSTTGGLHGPAMRPRQRHECEGGAVVAVTLIEDEHYRPRRCILVDPVTRGSVVLRFSSAPATRRFVGWSGFSYFLHRDVGGTPVELAVRDGNAELGTHGATPAAGWQRFELNRSGPSGVGEVEVRREAAEPGDFCFAMEAR